MVLWGSAGSSREVSERVAARGTGVCGKAEKGDWLVQDRDDDSISAQVNRNRSSSRASKQVSLYGHWSSACSQALSVDLPDSSAWSITLSMSIG